MSEAAADTGPAAPSEPTITPQAASEQRASLMADAAFRSKAGAANSAEWQTLTRLNEAIAASQDAAETEVEQQAPGATQPAVEDPEIPPGFFDPPRSPGGYDLPSTQARQSGLDVDPQAEMDLRIALHGAGADPALARNMYTVAMTSAKQDLTPVTVQAEYIKAEGALRKAWGADFDQRLALANNEGRRLFEALPASIKDGMSYAEFALVSGMANNKAIVHELYLRAKARVGAKKAPV